MKLCYRSKEKPTVVKYRATIVLTLHITLLLAFDELTYHGINLYVKSFE